MSDQDFFFDEDEQPAKPAASAPAAKASKASAAPAQAAGTQNVSMTVTALVGVIAALLGVIIGIFVGQSLAGPAVPVTTGQVPGATSGPMGSQPAPQLTEEQMQGGELPQGHPDISGMGSSSGATGSAETTGQ